MRAVVQRVLSASVCVDGKLVGQCGRGLMLLVGAKKGDTGANAKKLADRVFGMRIFNDAEGKMNLSFTDAGGEGMLAVSNFTVYGDAMASRRPSFIEAAPYDEGKALFQSFVQALSGLGVTVETGEFGADMQVSLVNDGPVTVIVDC